MRTKSWLPVLIVVIAIVSFCACFVYAVHMGKNPSFIGDFGPLFKVEMTVDPSNRELKQHDETNLP